jgi:uncharacterized radical SAM protein YgiQ
MIAFSDLKRFLPLTRAEMDARDWRELDILLVTGDAYFDHPSNAVALLGRLLEHDGYRIGIVARPNWNSLDDFRALGRPTLFAGVTAGAVDSSVNNYTASGAKRRRDVYAPGGEGGGRPDQATLVYSNRLREAFPGLPIILGGIEASSRRFAYFDERKQKLRRSLLVDSRADLLVYGPGEQQIVEIAARLATGANLENIQGTVRLVPNDPPTTEDLVRLDDFEAIENNLKRLVAQSLAVESSGRPGFANRLTQRYAEGTVIAEPRAWDTPDGLERCGELAFTLDPHPHYDAPIPALETIRWSVVSHRGCPGGCSFCGLASHQGRRVIARSTESILAEVERVAAHPEFKGTISDIGGPTANAFAAQTKDLSICDSCRRPSCLVPKICTNLSTDHHQLLILLDRAQSVSKIKRVLLASGIRHDLALKSPEFIARVAKYHTGGHLKVAPEHVDPQVLKHMRKPPIELFEEFEALFKDASHKAGKKQYLVPYFIAAFPGCRPFQGDAVGHWLKARGQRLEQVQIYIPLAGTVAAAMQATSTDEKGKSLYIPDHTESRRQKSQLTKKPAPRKVKKRKPGSRK